MLAFNRLFVSSLMFAAALVVAGAARAATTFSVRGTYNTAAGPADATENFNSYTVDSSFQAATVAVNGFTLAQEGPGGFRNTVDAAPLGFTDNNGTGNASCFVNDAEFGPGPTNVLISFPAPVKGFGADFYGVQGALVGAEGLRANVFDGTTLIGTYNFQELSALDAVQFFGVVAADGEQITSIRLEAATGLFLGPGEGFGMDDAAITIAVPEPAALALVSVAGLGLLRRRRDGKSKR